MIALALLLAVLVSGCCRHDIAAPGIPLDTAVMATVSWFVTSRGWKTRRPRGDSSATDSTFKQARHRVAFLFLRARHLLDANPSWQSEPNQPTLRTRLAAELESVSHTIDSLVGTVAQRGPLFGGPDPVPPALPYLDIGVLATHIHGDDPAPVTIADAVAASAPDRRQGIVLAALDERRDRTIGIAWRAAAIDDELWTESGATSTLSTAGLRELIDRRMYSLELLQYQVNSGAKPDGIGGQFVDRQWVMQDWFGVGLIQRAALLAPGPDTNSFVDNLPHRVMEPPSIPRDGFVKEPPDPDFGPDTRPRIKDTEIDHFPARPRLAAGINSDPWTVPHSSTSMIIDGPPWFDHPETGQLDWNVWPGTQVLPLRVQTDTDLTANPPTTITTVRKPADQAWRVFQSDMDSASSTAPPGYAWVLKETTHAADSIDRLFRPTAQWWLKSWLHADGALSAVHLQALRFALMRADGKPEPFEDFASRTTLALDDYFGLRGYQPAPNTPMRAGRTERFENLTLEQDKLQVGDQVVIESLVPFLLASWWEYPTALISDVDINPDTGRLAIDRLVVQGYASTNQSFSAYRRLLVQLTQETLDQMRTAIVAAPATEDSLSWDTGRVFHLPTSADLILLHRWSPYPHAWDPPEPWWVRIHLDNPLWKGLIPTDLETLMVRLPKSVAWPEPDQFAVEVEGKIRRYPAGAGFIPPPTISQQVTGPGTVTPVDPHNCVYLPLWEPFGTFSDGVSSVGWSEFFKSAEVRNDPTSALQPVRADAAWIGGLFGAPDAVRVIRPRLKKL